MNILSLPNLLTIFRILILPAYIIVLIEGNFLFALILFALGMLTDLLDGLLARNSHQETKVGNILDPIADKLIINASFIILSILKLIPWWATILILSRDLFIVIGWVILHFTEVVNQAKPNIIGKITTFFQSITIIVTLFNFENLWPKTILIGLTLLMTLASGLGYFISADKMIVNKKQLQKEDK